MVAAGEAGGILDTILLRLATFMEKNDALVRKVKGAMIYPAVIFTVAVGAIVFLLIFVIPIFAEHVRRLRHGSCRCPTRIVIGLSDFLKRFWWADRARGIGGVVFGDQALLRHAERAAQASTG